MSTFKDVVLLDIDGNEVRPRSDGAIVRATVNSKEELVNDVASSALFGYTVTLATTGWGTSTEFPGYYEKVLSVTKVIDLHPTWGLVPVTGVPSTAEVTAYGLLRGLVGNSVTRSIKFLATGVPATALTINIKGVL